MNPTFPLRTWVLLSLLWLPRPCPGVDSPAVPDYGAPAFLAGTVLAPNTKQVLFTFTRAATNAASRVTVQRDFAYQDGKLAARERVVYESNAPAVYQLEELQTGSSGRATIHRTPGNPAKGSIDFEWNTGPGTASKTRTESLEPDTLISDMIAPFLAAHWTALQRGEKVKCRYIVLSRLETVGFTFSRVSEENHGNPAVVTIKMEATSPFIAALVDPLFFTLEQAPPHHVLQYVGRTTPKEQVGSKWKDLDALTVFDWK